MTAKKLRVKPILTMPMFRKRLLLKVLRIPLFASKAMDILSYSIDALFVFYAKQEITITKTITKYSIVVTYS